MTKPRHEMTCIATSAHAYPSGRDEGRMRISEYDLPSGFELRNHGHASAHLCFVLEGGFEEHAATRTESCARGMLRHSPPGDSHHMNIAEGGMRCLLLHATDSDDDLPQPDGRRFLDVPELAVLASELRAELHEGASASPLNLEGVALELLAQAARYSRPRAGRRTPTWLLALRDRLHDSFREPLSLDSLAAGADRHAMHVARAFRESFGCSIGDYVRRLQTDEARRLIVESEAKLADVALEAGFVDQSHMTRHVRRALGCTPGALRRAARN